MAKLKRKSRKKPTVWYGEAAQIAGGVVIDGVPRRLQMTPAAELVAPILSAVEDVRRHIENFLPTSKAETAYRADPSSGNLVGFALTKKAVRALGKRLELHRYPQGVFLDTANFTPQLNVAVNALRDTTRELIDWFDKQDGNTVPVMPADLRGRFEQSIRVLNEELEVVDRQPPRGRGLAPKGAEADGIHDPDQFWWKGRHAIFTGRRWGILKHVWKALEGPGQVVADDVLVAVWDESRLRKGRGILSTNLNGINREFEKKGVALSLNIDGNGFLVLSAKPT